MSLDEKLKAFTEILKIVAWPGIVVWLFWYLRDEIKRVAARIVKLGFGGAEAEFARPSPEQIPSSPTKEGGLPSPGSQPAAQAQGSSLIQQYISNVRVGPGITDEQLDWAVKGVKASASKMAGGNLAEEIEALSYTVASLNLQLAHEKNYNTIFGSQLRLLQQMTSAGGVLPQTARQVFEQAKAAYPDFYRSFTFEQWIGFLEQSWLCTRTQDGNYMLTPFGRGFLKYILDRHLSQNKPF